MKKLIVILGDQLDSRSPAIAAATKGRDVLWMVEAKAESTHV